MLAASLLTKVMTMKPDGRGGGGGVVARPKANVPLDERMEEEEEEGGMEGWRTQRKQALGSRSACCRAVAPDAPTSARRVIRDLRVN